MTQHNHNNTTTGIAPTITDPDPLPQRLFSIPHTPHAERQLLTFTRQVISNIVDYSDGAPSITVQNIPSGDNTIERRRSDTPYHEAVTITFSQINQRLLNIRSLLPDDTHYDTCPDKHANHPDLQANGQTIITLEQTQLRTADLVFSETAHRLDILSDHTALTDSQRRAFATISETMHATVFAISYAAKQHS